MNKGIIIKGISGKYLVYDGENYYECAARGIFRKNKIKPLPGDNVEFCENVIEKIDKRKNEFVRPAIANVDQMMFFISVRSPEPDMMLLDKMIITAFFKKVDFVLCVNKNDYEVKDFSDNIKNTYENIGVKVILASALQGTGTEEIYSLLEDKITVFAGQSGAGKSTMVNRIFENEVMQTGDVSRKTERGRHTTRHSELFLFNNGFIADTPGFSSYELPDLTAEDLRSVYPEFTRYSGCCKFKECTHINEPECAVKEALEDGNIDRDRYDRYNRFLEEVIYRKNNKYK